jgi:hypothetical protein
MNAFDSLLKFPCAHESAAEQFRPGRLWSLWDMQKLFAHEYVALGRFIHDAEVLFALAEGNIGNEDARSFRDEETQHIKDILHKMASLNL